MQRVDRLERLTNLLLALLETDRPLTLRQITRMVAGYPEEGEACRQAFERDKAVLRAEGVVISVEPVTEEGQLGYRIRPEDYYLPELDLTPEEQVALNLAVAGVHLDDATGRDALSKLGLPGDYGAAQVASLPSLPQLPVLHQALAERAPVSFRYRSKPRTVDGYGLAFRGGFWYLVGRDHQSGEERTFRVDRMDQAVSKGQPASYQVPPDYRLEEAIPSRPWALGEGEAVAAEVRIDPVLAGAVRSQLGEQAVVGRDPDGSLTFRLEVTNQDAFVSWVLGMLDHAVVVSPEALRQRVIEHLEAVAQGGRA